MGQHAGTMLFKHVILDRDGVLNVEAPDRGYVLEPEQFHWLPGALFGLATLRRGGVRISVATNQSAVGRGLMSLEQLESVHERMQSDAAAQGGALDAVLFCPHPPQANCACRKPAPGLIHAAMSGSGVNPAESLVVGDDLRDLEAAQRAGVSAALVRTGKGLETETRCRDAGVPAYDDLPQLARAVVEGTIERWSNTLS
jgi:D-glycero-D-manno-heptose 1,7-bisphosphate phosphatase